MALLRQLISNTATALIVIPIGLAASFLTPIATPTNLIVMGMGGHVFSDDWKLGAPLLIWLFVAAVSIVPLIWRF